MEILERLPIKFSNKKINMRLIVLLIACCVLSCKQNSTTNIQNQLPFFNSADFAPHWLNENIAANSIHTINNFSFINQEGKRITQDDFKNKIYVANFFFTSCPGICKTLTKNLLLVQNEFLKDDAVMILSHSVTPDIDSVERLKLYASDFNINSKKWFLATGNKDSIYSIARKSYFADEDLGEKKSTNDFLHTENIVLIDKQKRIRGVYKGTSVLQIKDLINDIKQLEKEG